MKNLLLLPCQGHSLLSRQECIQRSLNVPQGDLILIHKFEKDEKKSLTVTVTYNKFWFQIQICSFCGFTLLVYYEGFCK